MNVEHWEIYAWELQELTEAHGYRKAVRLLDTPAQRAHRLNTVESDLADDQTLLDYHRKLRRAD